MKKRIRFETGNKVKTMQNLMLISNPLKKLPERSCDKIISEKVTEKLSFLLFLVCAKVSTYSITCFG
jgi:hypothetical protein